jgi:hypothetical protein
MVSHEALDPIQRLDDLLVCGGVADPNVAGARGSEGGPGHDPDALLGSSRSAKAESSSPVASVTRGKQ